MGSLGLVEDQSCRCILNQIIFNYIINLILKLNNIYAVDIHLLSVFEHRSENYISLLILNALVH